MYSVHGTALSHWQELWELTDTTRERWGPSPGWALAPFCTAATNQELGGADRSRRGIGRSPWPQLLQLLAGVFKRKLQECTA